MLHPRCPEPVKVLLAAFVLVFGVLQELKSSGRSVPAIHEASGKIDVASPEYFSCTIPRENRLSCEEFAENYLGKQPVVLKGLGHSMARFAGKCSHEALLESPRYGSLRVNVSTANAFTGRTLKEVNVHEYLQKFLLPQDLNKQGNETYYLFGGHHGRLWQEFLDDYEVPPFPTESLRSVLGADTSVSHKTLCASVDKLVTSLSFGIAGRNTGVPFHFHGPGFLQVIYGRKRWLLYPPGSLLPQYEPNVTTYQWVHQVLPYLDPQERPYDCILDPGDVVYFPSEWLHATLNLDNYNVFISTFA